MGKISLLRRVTGAKWEVKRSAFPPPSVNITPQLPSGPCCPCSASWPQGCQRLDCFSPGVRTECTPWPAHVSHLRRSIRWDVRPWLSTDQRPRKDVAVADEQNQLQGWVLHSQVPLFFYGFVGFCSDTLFSAWDGNTEPFGAELNSTRWPCTAAKV